MSRLPALVAALLLAGCARPPAPVAVNPLPNPPDTPPDQVLAAGVAYLVAHQSPDGAWRSDIYATFKDGPALTPLVLLALTESADAASAAARRKGCAYLAGLVQPDGTIAGGEAGLDYPVYTAALAVKVLSHPENTAHVKARDAWLKYLLDRQLTAELGWAPGDAHFGGWGYCRVVPKKPAPNAVAPPLVESNLSATVHALDALRAAGFADADVYRDATYAVARFQNFDPAAADPGDGGFFFVADDPVRNKAGADGDGSDAPRVFRSYGSTTADGLRGLGTSGLDDPARTRAAAAWLAANFRADAHPGKYVAAHERNRDAVYFYYAASAGRAFRDHKLTLPDGRDAAAELATALSGRQQPDGSWANPVELVRENDPLVATSHAVVALASARRKSHTNQVAR